MRKKARIKDCIVCDSIYVKFPDQRCLGLEVGVVVGLSINRHEGTFGDNGNVLTLDSGDGRITI